MSRKAVAVSKAELRARLAGEEKIADPTKTIAADIKLAVAFAMGAVFGFALEKGRVMVPSIIIKQMLLENFLMMKMFLSAAGGSMVVYGLMSLMPPTRKYFSFTRKKYRTKMSALGWPAGLLGGVIIGIGMSLTGSCPGTVAAQLGAGVMPSATVTLLGCIFGGFLYGFVVEPDMKQTRNWKKCGRNKDCLDSIAGVQFAVIAVPMGLALLGGAYGLECYSSWQSEIDVDVEGRSTASVLFWPALPPMISGILIALLQIPAAMILGSGIGASTAYVSLCGHALTMVGAKKDGTNVKYFMSVLNHWSPFFLFGGVLGAGFSAITSGTFGSIEGTRPVLSGIGGILLVIGARVASGCPSGNGISGMSQLGLVSIVVVVGMFLGGIPSAFFFRGLENYKNLNL